MFAEAIRSALDDAGMEAVGVVTTGRAALAFLEDDRPDVI
ncbi:MAG: hypothetical protein ACR2L4_09325, partial [Actinomycetota bacterium]